MEHTRKLHTWGGFLLLLVLLVAFLIWNLLAGSVRLPASEIWAVLHGGGDLTQRRILLNIRLPRLLAAMILGGALSVSGFLLQTFFHNPIAGPFVLGISSGAKFTVAVTMILLLSRGVTSSSAALIAAAFVGAMGRKTGAALDAALEGKHAGCYSRDVDALVFTDDDIDDYANMIEHGRPDLDFIQCREIASQAVTDWNDGHAMDGFTEFLYDYADEHAPAESVKQGGGIRH